MKLIDVLVEELPKRGGWDAKWHQCAQDGNGEVCFFTDGEINFRRSFDAWSIPSHGVARHDGKARFGLLLADDYQETIITREQYEAALAAKNEGWIEWGGGKCPVYNATKLDIKFLTGGIVSGVEAGKYYWPQNGHEYDIIAYRLHQPQKAEQAEADDEVDLNECIGQDAAPVWNGDGLPPVGCECEFISNDTSWGAVVVIGMDGDKVVIKPSGETYYGITPSEKQFFRPIRSECEQKRDIAVGKIFDVICKSLTDESESTSFAIYDAIAAGEIPGVKLED